MPREHSMIFWARCSCFLACNCIIYLEVPGSTVKVIMMLLHLLCLTACNNFSIVSIAPICYPWCIAPAFASCCTGIVCSLNTLKMIQNIKSNLGCLSNSATICRYLLWDRIPRYEEFGSTASQIYRVYVTSLNFSWSLQKWCNLPNVTAKTIHYENHVEVHNLFLATFIFIFISSLKSLHQSPTICQAVLSSPWNDSLLLGKGPKVRSQIPLSVLLEQIL